MKRGGGGVGDGHGEIIQVQGGHILRATGRKDRHSKVYTSKGPRDRRVRLSAHTAIQFYDVQDRLGYDRPSKAVDWLIKKAKDAIDKLAELPHNHPNEITTAAPSTDSNPGSSGQGLEHRSESSSVYAIQHCLHDNPNGNSGVIPSGVNTQSIADTMKSFFPVSPGNSLMNMQSYPDDRMSRQPSIQTEDLGLSLHSLQHQNLNHRSYNEQMLFSGSNQTMFGADEANYQHKTESWSTGAAAATAGEGENRNNIINGFIFNSIHSMPQQQQLLFSQNSSSAFSQRESLQSNYSHLFHHAWNDQRQMPSVDHHNNAQAAITQSPIYNIHFGSDFQVPARIRGDEEPGAVSLQPSLVSPSSQH
ncbi:hypothetical protein ACH5RR_028641 [Cinchona calisaya]|uniref:TCP domain-containing protein n=1 Tax=Cinchona calisaya TaxID=153742 RepID=A0ABD2YPD3_9GENT